MRSESMYIWHLYQNFVSQKKKMNVYIGSAKLHTAVTTNGNNSNWLREAKMLPYFRKIERCV